MIRLANDKRLVNKKMRASESCRQGRSKVTGIHCKATGHCEVSRIPEEPEWNKGIYPQTLIIPNLERWHKKERMCKEPGTQRLLGDQKGN